MKNLKKKISLAILLISFIFLVSIFFFFKSLASPGMTCQLTYGSCSSGICLFSLNRTTNSHAGDCNYDDWKLCCDESGVTLTSVVRAPSSSCNPNEAGVISLNSLSNSHAWNYSDSDGMYHVCLSSSSSNPFRCNTVNGPCNIGECLVSLSQVANTHVAQCGDYPNSICCGYACEGSISISYDGTDCGQSNFTVTVNNTGFEHLTVDINDTLWEDSNCDSTPDVLVDYSQWLNEDLPPGSSINKQWETTQAADRFSCYIHILYFCSDSVTCQKGTSSCLTEATAGNIAIQTDSFQCEAGAVGICGDGIVDFNEDCDMGPPVRWGACQSQPWTKCGLPGWSLPINPADECKCYDFRYIDCFACTYYDWCQNGYDPNNPTKSCCVNKTDMSQVLPCCIRGGLPEINCSLSGAVYNYLEVNASSSYCFNANCDITGKCIDSSWVAHKEFTTC